jgi:hypothetical protein
VACRAICGSDHYEEYASSTPPIKRAVGRPVFHCNVSVGESVGGEAELYL